ncbi:hypothetical protein CWR48_00470 [Oceanobacillus arenosus]|uniref:Two component regulator three Y domain-containing protein n=1 Tax=Oceanobacillus arenosus TaxID=1229153 RepID=A0A3D8Q1Q6_9BACI|nr:accessory Sec system protein Asp2 [Oceanobacillus arenosus]RDW22214.1 hypothetical protein CWR48_00470 [Oceanobacillus arenosus]
MKFSQEEILTFNPYKDHNLDVEVRLVLKDIVKNEFSHLIVIKPRKSVQIKVKELDNHLLYKYKYQIKSGNKWQDHIMYQNIIEENETDEGIKYLFFPGNRKTNLFAKKKDNHLIVIFQGIKDLNRTTYYNYIKTLKDVNAPRLYIKDDYGTDEKTHTSYYLGPNKSFTISDKVLNLIEAARTELDIDKENVICAGSSKGGYAALYFSHKGKYGYAVVGGPQILIGNYLSNGKIDGHEEKSILPPILRYLCGEITVENIEWANNILLNEIKRSEHQPNIALHVGKDEPHYPNHVVPLLHFFEETGRKEIQLDLGDYSTHKDLAKHFPDFLERNVKAICDSN